MKFNNGKRLLNHKNTQMKAVVQPSKLKGTITAPASKSAMQRACAASLIRKGETELLNPGVSNDDKAALNIIKQLGATYEVKGDRVIINSNGINAVGNELDCHESGLSIRMFTSIAALSDQLLTIKGSGSLAKRPMNFFDEVLPQLGVSIESEKGYLPLRIKGPLRPQNITVDGSLSSQYLTGLLFAYAAADAKDVSIKVTNLNSRPYVDLTLQVIKAFGFKVPQNKNYEEFYFSSEQILEHKPFLSYTVEGDWSGGAFLLVGAAIAGNVVVKGLDHYSTQADKAIIQALSLAGANMSIESDQIEIRESKLKAFQFNATDCPDLFPPLVALAAYCEGTTVIEGAKRLTHKESNRALTLQEEFGKMGIKITLQDDLMLIEGTGKIKGTEVSAHNDHRIAMANAIAALKADGPMEIIGAESVNKSYPQFWQHIQELGADVTLKEI
jgi:3-phosphoshikimate 1-carboxyvinyltransferase